MSVFPVVGAQQGTGFGWSFIRSWNTIKEDLMIFSVFHQGTFPLHSLNFGTIILLPKRKDAKVIPQ
jgi:hypothetical protein